MANQISVSQIAYLVIATKYDRFETAVEGEICRNLGSFSKARLTHIFKVADRVIGATSINEVIKSNRAPSRVFVSTWVSKLKEIVATVAQKTSPKN